MDREWLNLAQWRAGEFTEQLHPRDPSGKFGSGSAGGAAKPAQQGFAPAKKQQGFQKAKTKAPPPKSGFGKAKLQHGFSKAKTKGKSQAHFSHTKTQKFTGKKKPAGLTPDDKAVIKTLSDLIAVVSEQMTGLANSGNKKAAMQLAQVIAAAKNRITKIQNKAEQ